jgi:hypothetical protein
MQLNCYLRYDTSKGCGSGSAWIRIILGSRIGIKSKSKSGSWSESASDSKFKSCVGSKWSNHGQWTLTIEAWRLEMEPCRVCRPVVEICITLMRSRVRIRYYPHQSEQSDQDPQQRKEGFGSRSASLCGPQRLPTSPDGAAWRTYLLGLDLN